MRPLPMVGGMLDTVVRALSKSDLFGALRPDQLRKVAHRGELLQCADGEQILTAGEPSSGFFVVLSGEVVVETPGAAEVARLGSADVVGEMGVLLKRPRTANVRAEGPTLVLRFDDTVFDAMFERIPGFGLAISRALSRRLEATNLKLVT
jgi:CRP/FNR family cyclic AMP-dependent transcriptional regulator